MEWIKVSERLPEPKYGPKGEPPIISDEVWIHWPDGTYSVGSYDAHTDEWYDNERGISPIDPFHWAVIEPPKELI